MVMRVNRPFPGIIRRKRENTLIACNCRLSSSICDSLPAPESSLATMQSIIGDPLNPNYGESIVPQHELPYTLSRVPPKRGSGNIHDACQHAARQMRIIIDSTADGFVNNVIAWSTGSSGIFSVP
jgi:hypothetical protein